MKRKKLALVFSIALVLIGIRLALPSMVKVYLNGRFSRIGEYSAHIADVDIALLRGAYTLTGVVVVKQGVDSDAPFLNLESMDISVEWKALFAGELVGEILAVGPSLNFIQDKSSEKAQLGTGVNWQDELRELFPFRFNRIEVTHGAVAFLAPGIESTEALQIRDAHLVLSNLTNIHEDRQEAVAEIELTGTFMQDAPLKLTGNIDPSEASPKFDIDFTLEQAALQSANPWLREFLNVDAESGVFSMYLEAAAAEGRFEGYIKPIMEDLVVFAVDKETEGPLHKAWEALIQFGANIFENRQEDQVATRIPYSGEFEDPDIGAVAAIVSLIGNAFVSALSRSLEGSVELEDLSFGAGAQSD